ncbi:MAG: MFS transporter [Phenylobacterium sp.]|nr:MFS transporter [Phenylobacterium sp.]
MSIKPVSGLSDTTGPSAPADPDAGRVSSPAYQRLLLGVLVLVLILNVLDRQVINVLAEPIKRDLGLSDTQLGLVTGLFFAIFYNSVSIPLGRIADNLRTNRVHLISGCLAIWSGMTALCGVAQSFWHLVLARIGVAAGEAGCVPPAHSLIADTVPKAKLAMALAIFGLGSPIGAFLGKSLGGILNDLFGWRAAFFIVGVPGILVAVLMWLLLRDPRTVAVAKVRRVEPKVPLREVIAEIRGSKAFVNIILAVATAALLGAGGSVWGMIHFLRNHELSTTQAGIWLGLIGGIGGGLGTWIGGVLADRWGQKNPRHYMTPQTIGLLCNIPFLFFAWYTDNWVLAIALLILPDLFDDLYYGGTFASVQGLVSRRVRATATASMLFVTTLLGTGLGALSFGFVSDLLIPYVGDRESVRLVLMGSAFLYVVPAYFFWRAGCFLKEELDLRAAAEAKEFDISQAEFNARLQQEDGD